MQGEAGKAVAQIGHARRSAPQALICCATTRHREHEAGVLLVASDQGV